MMFNLTKEQEQALRIYGFPFEREMDEKIKSARSIAKQAREDMEKGETPEIRKTATDAVHGCSVVLSYFKNTGISRDNPDGRLHSKSVHTYRTSKEGFAEDVKKACEDLFRFDEEEHADPADHKVKNKPTPDDIANLFSSGKYWEKMGWRGIVFERGDGSVFSIKGGISCSSIENYEYRENGVGEWIKFYADFTQEQLASIIRQPEGYRFFANDFCSLERMTQMQRYELPKDSGDTTKNKHLPPTNYYLGAVDDFGHIANFDREGNVSTPYGSRSFREDAIYVSPVVSSNLYFKHLKDLTPEEIEKKFRESYMCFFREERIPGQTWFTAMERGFEAVFYLKYEGRVKLSDGTETYAYSRKSTPESDPQTVYFDNDPAELRYILSSKMRI